jgi:hypothetical protein
MPKWTSVVLVVCITNAFTLLIYSSFQFENTYLNSNPAMRIKIPQPILQDTNEQSIQTGRVIQSVDVFEPQNKNNAIVENMFAKRKTHIDEYCSERKKHPSEPFTDDPTKLLVLSDRRIVWCPVFKAGSSTWLSIMVDLSSKSQVNLVFQNWESTKVDYVFSTYPHHAEGLVNPKVHGLKNRN